ncbi:MAG: response regulator transcription factor [Aliiglaciecola sp.]|uniref:response regulator transcription factor n=1 Tax=Aliiglaciecola sp. M165 TaxID=2593649 RepID=UPI00117C45CA|nr:response regulator transcription factor [Aliiglaciecola sp. M165]TRY33859.1 response regulator transcription factor [Aliiglaciecola sp. M165]
MTTLKKILLVEDDVAIAEGLADFLHQHPYELDFAYRGDHAQALINSQHYDLILLDLNLPGKSGLQICASLSADNALAHTPVLIMTANNQLDTKLKGFEAGAWDYLTKPFSFKELEARIKVLLQLPKPNSQQTLAFGELHLNAARTEAIVNEHSIKLTATELVIIGKLLEHAPEPVSHAVLTRALWGEDVPESDPLRAHIYHLRQSLKEVSRQIEIVLVKGIGYCLKHKLSHEDQT